MHEHVQAIIQLMCCTFLMEVIFSPCLNHLRLKEGWLARASLHGVGALGWPAFSLRLMFRLRLPTFRRLSP